MSLIKNARVGGAVCAAIGLAIGFGYLRYLVNQAEQGVEEITLYEKVFLLATAFTVMGLFCVVVGDKAEQILKMDPQNINFVNIVVMGVLLVAGFFAYQEVMHVLAGYGYERV
jgi:hypothetical protein